MQLKSEIISVGTELLLGQIIDTNAPWIAEKLNQHGIDIYHKQTVGDNFFRLKEAFELAQSRSDLVIVTGGLGPTEDDLTREVAAELFNTEIQTDAFIFNKIKQYYMDRDKYMTINNEKQAYSFTGGDVYENEVGMAPGLHYYHEDTHWFFLPGVPKEMEWLMEHKIFPYLMKNQLVGEPVFHRTLQFYGIGEATLETELLPIIQKQTNPTIAPLAGYGFVNVRLSAKALNQENADALIEPVEKEILNLVGEYFMGYVHEEPLRDLLDVLRSEKLTIGCCESLTGGLFGSEMVSLSGASQIFSGSIVAYSNEVKKTLVHVSETTLEQHGAVSHLCASEMANNTKKILNVDCALSFTGVAGPDKQDGIDVGTVIIGLAFKDEETKTFEVNLKGDRNQIRQLAVNKGVQLLYQRVIEK
ncbi:competence/damage-inducible protein A [Halalkalibacillus halophilus]|uniref:competence/damage-inducible protein A n=1 Tax=Halalkalibacillus halophilus TaxID=392827 RepID=UPI00040F3455|nr:competence/damage-inducible protein A [Halalkalibacillus halophilus]